MRSWSSDMLHWRDKSRSRHAHGSDKARGNDQDAALAILPLDHRYCRNLSHQVIRGMFLAATGAWQRI